MAFVPENALEDALVRAIHEPLARPDFYRLLMETELLVLGRTTGDAAQPDLTIPSLRHNGREYLPVFSGTTRLKSFVGEGREHFTMQARPLFEAARGANFALNPNSECGKLLMAAEIAFWLDPSARARRKLNAAKLTLGAPTVVPTKLVEALRIFFRNRSSVLAGYLLEAAPLDGSEPPHPLVGIETAENWPKIAAEVSELAAAIAPDVILDLVRIDRTEGADGVSGQLARTAPFYARTPTPH